LVRVIATRCLFSFFSYSDLCQISEIITPPLIVSGRGFCLRSISLFICLFCLCFFVSKITSKRLDRFACHFQGRCRVTMGRPNSILAQFGETARCRNANFFVSICQHYQQSALLAVLCCDCCHLATENVTNFSTSQHGGAVCCAFAPQLVKTCIRYICT